MGWIVIFLVIVFMAGAGMYLVIRNNKKSVDKIDKVIDVLKE